MGDAAGAKVVPRAVAGNGIGQDGKRAERHAKDDGQMLVLGEVCPETGGIHGVYWACLVTAKLRIQDVFVVPAPIGFSLS